MKHLFLIFMALSFWGAALGLMYWAIYWELIYWQKSFLEAFEASWWNWLLFPAFIIMGCLLLLRIRKENLEKVEEAQPEPKPKLKMEDFPHA